MILSILERFYGFHALALGELANMPKQLPTHASVFIFASDRDRDFPFFQSGVASKHTRSDDRLPVLREGDEVFGLPILDLCHGDQLIMPDFPHRVQKAKAQILGRHMREEFGQSRFVIGPGGPYQKPETRACVYISKPKAVADFIEKVANQK